MSKIPLNCFLAAVKHLRNFFQAQCLMRGIQSIQLLDVIPVAFFFSGQCALLSLVSRAPHPAPGNDKILIRKEIERGVPLRCVGWHSAGGLWWSCSGSNRGIVDYEPSPLAAEVQDRLMLSPGVSRAGSCRRPSLRRLLRQPTASGILP